MQSTEVIKLETINDIILRYSKKPNVELVLKPEAQLEIKFLDDRLKDDLPGYQTQGSAGIDLSACIQEELTLEPNETKLIGTGLAINLKNPMLCGMILPRSGLGHKQGLVLGNLVGLIDSDYQGELKVSLWNRSTVKRTIKPMDRIAQLVIVPVLQVAFDVVDSFDTTERGEGGFGSTG